MESKDKLAIFDLDGTLFNTLDVNYYAYAEAAKQFGFSIDREKFLKISAGKNYKEFLPEFGVVNCSDQEKIHESKKILYSLYLNKAVKNEYLFSLIDSIKKDYLIALATTASKCNTLDILQKFGVLDQFNILITQEDTVKLKPDPECYIMAMKKAKLLPANTIIFEDSDVGIMAANASGAYVIRVSMNEHNFL